MGLSRQFLNLLVDNGIPRAKSLHCVKLTRHRLFNTTKPTMLPLIGDGNEPKNNNQSMEKIVLPRPSFNLQLLGQEEDRRSEMQEQRDANDDDKEVTDDEDYSMDILFPKSRHRDGSIYRGIMDTWWKKELRIADRNEKLAEIHNDGCLVELYGYIAVRDDLDPLLNYIINFSRDDPIIVEQRLADSNRHRLHARSRVADRPVTATNGMGRAPFPPSPFAFSPTGTIDPPPLPPVTAKFAAPTLTIRDSRDPLTI
uniref:Uncharacterized protein n=1 Tax=Oryza sativa subsp. japonica TaxID=39947 RepID=Q7EYL8_ORYSJ|nr:hypothetical protein [Oryza sativa Japonica Group]